jgi:transcription elongation factor GreA
MRVPIRKPGKYTFQKRDPNITQAKFDELKKELDHLEKNSRPRAITEMQRLAELGDFSENAAYQMAKGKLRGINERIAELEKDLKFAVIITPVPNNGIVQLGTSVTIEIDGKQRTYTLLGSAETDPQQGIISHQSPIGSALLGRRVGDVVSVKLAEKNVSCRIVSIQ